MRSEIGIEALIISHRESSIKHTVFVGKKKGERNNEEIVHTPNCKPLQ